MKEEGKDLIRGLQADIIYENEALPTSSIDWKKIRDTLVPPIAEDDPNVAQLRTLLKWLDENPAPEGNDPFTGMSYSDMHDKLRQDYLNEIERYRWRRAGFSLNDISRC